VEVIKINNRTHKVFVLDKTEKRIVYIPVKSCHRVDYDRLRDAEKQAPKNYPLLDYLKKKKFDNGRNALDVLDKIIQVADLVEGGAVRLAKPDEAESFTLSGHANDGEHVVKKATVQTLNENAGETEKKVVDGNQSTNKNVDPNNPIPNTQYYYEDKAGKPKIWTGQGRMPNAIREAIDSGEKTLVDFVR
tara:strand:- start:621 stop:1190 length:570 start_codon:yes stop_codon:yes gene_type:complete